jgi:hypothetical protein
LRDAAGRGSRWAALCTESRVKCTHRVNCTSDRSSRYGTCVGPILQFWRFDGLLVLVWTCSQRIKIEQLYQHKQVSIGIPREGRTAEANGGGGAQLIKQKSDNISQRLRELYACFTI